MTELPTVPMPVEADRATAAVTRPRRRLWTQPWVTTPLVVVVLVLAWDWAVYAFGISRFILPRPGVVLANLVDLLAQPWFYGHLRVTLIEITVGFAIACTVAISLGVILGKSPALERAANPLLVFLQVTPKVALMPLLLVILGFGISSKIAIAALLSFFPVLKNTVLGIRSIPTGHTELFTVLNASSVQRTRSLDLPFVLPYVLTGIETGIVLAVTGAIVGEYLAGQIGLGALVVISLSTLQVPRLFATIVVLAAIGFVLYAAVASLRRLLVPWHESSGSTPSV